MLKDAGYREFLEANRLRFTLEPTPGLKRKPKPKPVKGPRCTDSKKLVQDKARPVVETRPKQVRRVPDAERVAGGGNHPVGVWKNYHELGIARENRHREYRG